jgi:hypothetical protein
MLVEDMLRNNFFQLRISFVLLSTSICDLFTDSPSYLSCMRKNCCREKIYLDVLTDLYIYICRNYEEWFLAWRMSCFLVCICMYIRLANSKPFDGVYWYSVLRNLFVSWQWLMIVNMPASKVVSLLFYSILFYSILFYSILFYSILFYSILFYSILFYSFLLYYILFYSILLWLHSPSLDLGRFFSF